MDNIIKLEQMSYQNAKQVPILKACLQNWFKNPKDLFLTNPSMGYPFKFNKWLNSYDSTLEAVTFVLKIDDWIIAHMSFQLRPVLSSIHIFHVFVDRQNRSKGYSKLLIEKALDCAKTKQFSKITLGVVKKNPIAIKLYEKYGFEIVGENKLGSWRMELKL